MLERSFPFALEVVLLLEISTASELALEVDSLESLFQLDGDILLLLGIVGLQVVEVLHLFYTTRCKGVELRHLQTRFLEQRHLKTSFPLTSPN
jgi:hypothetical protein